MSFLTVTTSCPARRSQCARVGRGGIDSSFEGGHWCQSTWPNDWVGSRRIDNLSHHLFFSDGSISFSHRISPPPPPNPLQVSFLQISVVSIGAIWAHARSDGGNVAVALSAARIMIADAADVIIINRDDAQGIVHNNCYCLWDETSKPPRFPKSDSVRAPTRQL